MTEYTHAHTLTHTPHREREDMYVYIWPTFLLS